MARLITIYWRDIPSRVVVRRGRESIRENLPVRFQRAVNRAAMRAGKGGSKEYIDDWRRVTQRCGEDLQAAVDARISQLNDSYDDARLDTLARNSGLADNTDSEPQP